MTKNKKFALALFDNNLFLCMSTIEDIIYINIVNNKININIFSIIFKSQLVADSNIHDAVIVAKQVAHTATGLSHIKVEFGSLSTISLNPL